MKIIPPLYLQKKSVCIYTDKYMYIQIYITILLLQLKFMNNADNAVPSKQVGRRSLTCFGNPFKHRYPSCCKGEDTFLGQPQPTPQMRCATS